MEKKKKKRDRITYLREKKIQQNIAISRDKQKNVLGQNTTWENLILSKLPTHFYLPSSANHQKYFSA